MKKYYRVMPGKNGVFAEQCFAENFIGSDVPIDEDLTSKLSDKYYEFSKQCIPVVLGIYPGSTKISAGGTCTALWTLAKGIQKGDIVLCPDAAGLYRVGEVISDYQYVPSQVLPHRRSVQWLNQSIRQDVMSEGLKESTKYVGKPFRDITEHGDEIERLLEGSISPRDNDSPVEDFATFALESHLEHFLVQNWAQTELGKEYDIFEADGDKVGQQYQTDTGPIDILAIRKDKKELLVVELKKGRASDVVVGQLLRYMGYMLQELAEEGQTVKGIIIALEDDQRLRRALAAIPNIDFYSYQISFKLKKA